MADLQICICGAPLERRAFSANFLALACSQCKSRHFVSRDETAERTYQYDGQNAKYAEQGYLHGKQLRWAHRQLLRLPWTGRKVLEIGCFNGFFLDELRRAGADAFGVDVNQRAIDVGQALFGLKGRLFTDLNALGPFGPFDDIVCIDALEHLDSPAAFVQEIADLLADNGRLIVAGPTIERGFHDKSDYPPHHRWWFSRPGLVALLTGSGYVITDTVIQYDGALFFRNLVGKVIHGFSKREFYGDSLPQAPPAVKAALERTYAILSVLGMALFSLLRMPYCSTLIIATRRRS